AVECDTRAKLKRIRQPVWRDGPRRSEPGLQIYRRTFGCCGYKRFIARLRHQPCGGFECLGVVECRNVRRREDSEIASVEGRCGLRHRRREDAETASIAGRRRLRRRWECRSAGRAEGHYCCTREEL